MAKFLIPYLTSEAQNFQSISSDFNQKGVFSEMMGPNLAMDYYFLVASYFRTAVSIPSKLPGPSASK